jgi:hypothetical protein
MNSVTAYLLMILSPVALLVPYLNIRYSIVYSVLRKNHSKTYLKKNKGSFGNRMFFHSYKAELGRGWYWVNAAALLLELFSLGLALAYLLLWIVGYTLQFLWIPQVWAHIIIAIYALYILKLLYDKLIG